MASSPDRSPGAVAVTVTGEGGADEGDNGVGKDDDGDLDCAVCLQPCVHPVKLPCGHHFCFLCVKGIAFLSRKCAMCRLEIPWTCLENPELLREEDLRRSAEGGDGGANAWYYEGRNGWWQYDGRTSAELEAAFADSKEEVEVLVAGFIYVVDLVNMTQCRKNGTGRVRSVKRDLSSIPDKMGVAGLRLRDTRQQQPQQSAVPVDGGCARVGGGVGVAGAAGRPGGTGGGVPDRVRGGSSCDVPPSRNSSAPAVAVSRDDEPDCDVTSNFGRLRLDGSASSPPPPARNSRRQLLLQQQQLTQQQVQRRPGPVPDPDPDRPRPAPGARDADADGGFGDS